MTATETRTSPEDPTTTVGIGAASSSAVQIVALVERTLRDRWRSLLVWSLGLAGISAVQLAVYPSVASTAAGWQSMVDQWPQALREAFHLEAYTTGPGYLNTELFSMMFPLVLTAVALGAAAAATAGEEERGTADLLLSLPVTRGRVIAAKTIAMVLGVAVVAGAGTVAVVVGSPLVNLSVGTVDVLAAGLMTSLLGLLFGAFGLLLGVLTGHRSAVLGGGIALAIAAFLLNALAPLASWLEPWQKVSPFYWALHSDPLLHGVDWAMAGLTTGVALLLLAAAVWVFQRRDISSR